MREGPSPYMLSRPGRDRTGHAQHEGRGGWTSSGTRESIFFHHAPILSVSLSLYYINRVQRCIDV